MPYRLFWALALLPLMGCASQRGLFFDMTMEFGEGKPARIDGLREDGEWDDALSLPLSQGGDVLMKRSGDRLYLGILTNSRRVVAVAMLRDGHVAIARAGATLATARYVREGRLWRRTAPYQVVIVRGEEGGEVMDHLDRTGWTASLSAPDRENFVEYCIELPPEGLKLALAALMVNTGRHSPHWPAGIEDGLLEPRLLEGVAPTMLDFDVKKWARFVPDDPAS